MTLLKLYSEEEVDAFRKKLEDPIHLDDKLSWRKFEDFARDAEYDYSASLVRDGRIFIYRVDRSGWTYSTNQALMLAKWPDEIKALIDKYTVKDGDGVPSEQSGVGVACQSAKPFSTYSTEQALMIVGWPDQIKTMVDE